jgi:Zn-dependent M28 family amino/carboxypeptidase
VSDETLRDEFVVIGGHLDHVGRQSEKVYFPGAQDNASGAAAVMHIAEAFVRGGVKPRRSVVFVLFAAEEQGLNGARHFVEHSPLPLERCVAMLNLDCVARGDGIQLGGGKASPELWNLAREIDAAHAARTVEDTWYGGGADATPFFEAGVPTLYFANSGAYADIHSTSDAAETLDPQLHVDTARLAFLTAAEIAAGGYEREERQPRES